jgi:hypothetical protein
MTVFQHKAPWHAGRWDSAPVQVFIGGLRRNSYDSRGHREISSAVHSRQFSPHVAAAGAPTPSQ